MSRWYCIQSLPMGERIARRHLMQQNFHCHLPEVTILDKLKRHRVRPLFPCYLFVHFDVMDRLWRRIPSTIGVRRLFSADAETPIPLPPGYVEELMQEGRPELPAAPLYVEGDRVRLTQGPFKGATGLVHLTPSQRISVLLQILGAQRSVLVNPSYLAKLDG